MSGCCWVLNLVADIKLIHLDESHVSLDIVACIPHGQLDPGCLLPTNFVGLHVHENNNYDKPNSEA